MMLEKIKQSIIENQELPFAEKSFAGKDEKLTREVQIAACLVLLHTAFVDFSYPPSEQDAILQILTSHFDVSPSDAQDVLDLAEIVKQNKETTARLLKCLKEHHNKEHKLLVYATAWKIIKADKKVDSQELALSEQLGHWLGLDLNDQIRARRMIIEGQI